MYEIIETLIEILYPSRCPLCHQVLTLKEKQICPECQKKIHIIEEPICKKCGKSIEVQEKEYCEDCQRVRHDFTRGIAVFPYNEIMRESIAEFKFNNKREYGKIYGKLMADVLEPYLKNWNIQALIPVPLYKKKYKKRGYNQAELLAVSISQRYHIPLKKNLVQRVKETQAQKELGRKKRKNNLKNAFKIREHDVKLERVLLVDDIYTTGSTMDAIAEKLREQGIEEVYFIVLCIGNL